jgi:hypothetical protein
MAFLFVLEVEKAWPIGAVGPKTDFLDRIYRICRIYRIYRRIKGMLEIAQSMECLRNCK